MSAEDADRLAERTAWLNPIAVVRNGVPFDLEREESAGTLKAFVLAGQAPA